jgi:hypothetical protein
MLAGSERWWMAVGGGVALFPQDASAYYNLFVAFERLVGHGVAVVLELGGWYFAQQADNSAGGSFNVDVRWHFLDRPRWTMFFDGGAGMLVTDDEVPHSGLAFNFTPRLGLGWTWRPGVRPVRLRTGLRWQHISNAAILGKDSNPGRDALMVHVGAMWPP